MSLSHRKRCLTVRKFKGRKKKERKFKGRIKKKEIQGGKKKERKFKGRDSYLMGLEVDL